MKIGFKGLVRIMVGEKMQGRACVWVYLLKEMQGWNKMNGSVLKN